MIETRGGYAKTQRARSLPLFCARRTASASAPTTLMRSRVAIRSMRSARRLPSIARLPISSSPFLPTALRPVESEGQAHKPLAERPVQVEYFCHLFWTSAPIAFHSSECPSLFPECSDDWIASIIFTRQLKFDPERGHFHSGMRRDYHSPSASSHTCTCPWASVCHCSAVLSPITGVPSTNWRTQTGPMASICANFSAMPA